MNVLSLAGRLAALIATATLTRSADAQELYLTKGFPNRLLRIDGPTGAVLDERPVVGSTSLWRGLTLSPDGMLYLIDDLLPNCCDGNRLFRIDPATAQGEVVGDTDLPDIPYALAADPTTGRIYGSNYDAILFEIDVATGLSSTIGTIHGPTFDAATAMAFDSAGVLYLTDYLQVGLFTVDLTTAEATHICDLGSGITMMDVDFDPDGALWGSRIGGEMLRLDSLAPCEGETLPYTTTEVIGLAPVPLRDPCYADLTADGTLDLFDFLAFVNLFNAGDTQANCDGDGGLDLFDFLCFTNAFNAGC